MSEGSFIVLAHNAALLLSMAVLCDLLANGRTRTPVRLWQLGTGVVLGVIGIIVMKTSWKLQEGVVFDTRSILLSVSGLFFGVIPTAVAVLMTACARIHQGGPAAWAGVGVIITSGAIGALWREYRKKPLAEVAWWELYLLGLVVHVVMLSLMFTLPSPLAGRVLSDISLPVMTIYPIATVALGALLANRLRRRQIAVALRESEEEIRATLYGIGDGVIATDSAGRITRMNPIAEQLTGWPEFEALGRPLKEVFHIVNEDTRREVANPTERVLREGVVVGLANHTVLLARDGAERPIADSAAPIRDEQGQIAGVVLVFRDQAAERAAQKDLRESQQRYLMLFHEMLDGFSLHEMIYDEQGRPADYRFLAVNPAFERLTGLTAQSLVGKTVLEVMPNTESKWIQIYGHVALTGEPVSFENYSRVLGRHFDVRAFRPAPGQFACVFADITARKQAEDAVALAKDAADQANRAKDEFMARLSHELRTPLTPVLLAMAQWQEKPEFPPALRDDLTMMRRNLDLEARLLDDLLDVSRIVNGKMMLRRDVIDVHQKIANSLEIVAADIQDKQLKLNVRLQASATRMDGDPARIQQVIWNLLSNAIKFTPAGGGISVSTANTPDGCILVQISDSGMGIMPEVMPRLFKPFEQGGDQTTRGYGGLGLGLAICRSVAEMHGGNIAARSDGPGRGATFTLKLPTVSLPPRARMATAAPPLEPAAGRPRSILLVEDHHDTARLLSRVLKGWGYDVRVAQTVASALQAADSPFDLLLSDLGLPDGTGHDLMRTLSARRPIKAIAVSGYGMEEDQQRSREVGFLAHLTKPVNLPDLRATLERALSDS